jgi:hypothetical protein
MKKLIEAVKVWWSFLDTSVRVAIAGPLVLLILLGLMWPVFFIAYLVALFVLFLLWCAIILLDYFHDPSKRRRR